jgi:hypothetical protein
MSWKYIVSSPQSFSERYKVISRPAIAAGANTVLFFINPRYKSIIPRTDVKISALM